MKRLQQQEEAEAGLSGLTTAPKGNFICHPLLSLTSHVLVLNSASLHCRTSSGPSAQPSQELLTSGSQLVAPSGLTDAAPAFPPSSLAHISCAPHSTRVV